MPTVGYDYDTFAADLNAVRSQVAGDLAGAHRESRPAPPR
jgi:hypothetical protein